MKHTDNTLYFPIQITSVNMEVSDDQLACEVRMKLAHKLNRASSGEYVLTQEDKDDIEAANDVFRRNGYMVINVDLSQY